MRYCENCWTEFVDAVQKCSDCGGPLRDGDLPAVRQLDEGEDEGRVEVSAVDLAAIDSLVAELPGEEAEHFAEALRMEGLHSRLECGAIVRHRGPGQKATGLISLSQPVRVFVAEAELEPARDILELINQEDLVGDAWAENIEIADREDGEVLSAPDVVADSVAPPLETSAEGASSRSLFVLVLAVVVGLLLWFAFAGQ